MQCGLCGGDAWSAPNTDAFDEYTGWWLFACEGCGACSEVDGSDYDGVWDPPPAPAWIAAPLSAMIVRCLRVYGRDGRRVRPPGSKTCVAWERSQ